MALQLGQNGFSKAFALTGGFAAWKDAGLPLEPVAAADARRSSDAHQPL